MSKEREVELLICNGSVLNPLSPFEPERMDILVQEGAIAKLADSIPANRCERVLDAEGGFIIPGLINLHVHITRRHLHLQPLGVPFRQGAPQIENSPDTLRILWALRNAWTELAEGATTLRDAGSKHHISISLRNVFQSGVFDGPRLLTSGEPVAITGGHESHRYDGAREADGPSEVQKAVREQLRAGADWIKLMASAGIGGMPEREHPSITEFTFEELSAGILEAHKRHRRVLAHAMSDESVRFCLEAGVDTIEHGVLAADETVQLMKDKETGFVPTLSGIQKVHEREKAAGNAAFAEKLLHEVLEPHCHVVRKAIEAEVLIGTGSDTLGSVREEIAALVDCGMSPQAAFASATINSARILGLERKLGTIEVGKAADFVVLDGNPLHELGSYQQIREVVFAGRLLSETYPRAIWEIS